MSSLDNNNNTTKISPNNPKQDLSVDNDDHEYEFLERGSYEVEKNHSSNEKDGKVNQPDIDENDDEVSQLHDIVTVHNEHEDEHFDHHSVLQSPADENGEYPDQSTLVAPNAVTKQDGNKYYDRVKVAFTSLRQFVNLVYPNERKHKFQPRVRRDEVNAFQDFIGYEMPEMALAIYARHNGHSPKHPVQWCYGGEFLSLERIMDEIRGWRSYVADFTEDTDPCAVFQSDAEHGVKQVSWDEHWLPFAISKDGNEYLCIDLDPNPALGGIPGQIIAVSWYVAPREYVCADILTFFEYLVEKLLHGEVELSHINDGGILSNCTII